MLTNKKTKYIVVLHRDTKDEYRVPVRDFLNPKSSTYLGAKIKPRTYKKALAMLTDLLQGEIHLTAEHAIKLEGVAYRWDWA